MLTSEVVEITDEIKKAADAVDGLFALAFEVRQDLEAALTRLPGKLDLSRYSAPEIVDAIMRLGDRRCALTEQRHGRRNGGTGGAPIIQNGNGHHQAGPST